MFDVILTDLSFLYVIACTAVALWTFGNALGWLVWTGLNLVFGRHAGAVLGAAMNGLTVGCLAFWGMAVVAYALGL